VSIHVSAWPEAIERDEEAEAKGEAVKEIVAGIRSWKSAHGLSLNAEISRVEIVGPKSTEVLVGSEDDIQQTVRARDFELLDKVALIDSVARIKPIYAKLGPAFKRDSTQISERLQELQFDKVPAGDENLSITLDDGRELSIGHEFFEVEKKISSERGELEHISAGPFSVLVYK